MSAKVRTRETTSVSTLTTKVEQLIQFAVANKRRDILKVMVDLKPRTDALLKEYNALRAEIDPLHKLAFPKLEVSASDISLALAALEAEVEEETESGQE